jgi:hypothetical protein
MENCKRRVVLALDRMATVEEHPRVVAAVEAHIRAALGDAVRFDAASEDVARIWYAPHTDAACGALHGAPVAVDRAVAAAPPAERPTAPLEAATGDPVTEGRRNDWLASQGGRIRRLGLPESALLAALQALNAERCRPLLPDNEVQRIARSVGRYAPALEVARYPLIWMRDASPMLERDYLIKGFIGIGQLVLIYGASGSGKTFFTLDIGAHVACGRTWRGRRVVQGTVVYIAAESGIRFQRRVKAWRDAYAGGVNDPAFVIVPKVINLMDPNAADYIGELLAQVRAERDQPIVLVIIDTLARSLVGGDENSAQDMGRAVAVADAVRDAQNVATILVHHTGKDQDKGARGSSALFAAVDASLFVRVDDEHGHSAIIDKARDDATGIALRFKLRPVNLGNDDDGDPVGTCIVEHGEEVTATARGQRVRALPDGAALGVRVLSGLLESDADSDWRMVDGRRAVKLAEWRAAFDLAHGDLPLPDLSLLAEREEREDRRREQDRRRKRFQRARDPLVERGVIAFVGDCVSFTA